MRIGCWPPWAVAESNVPNTPTWAAVWAGPLSPPAASQPAPPWTTLVSPGPVPCQDGGVATPTCVHRPPAGRDQIAGAPSAWPTATCPPASTPRPLTLRPTASAAASAAWPTAKRRPRASSRNGRGRLAPAATTLPPAPTVTPVTVLAEDLPRLAVWRQDLPCTLTNATRYRPAQPAATTPWSLPPTWVTCSAAPRRAASLPAKRQPGPRSKT